MVISYLSFAVTVALYALAQLQIQGRLKWSKRDNDFWGRDSDKLKYKKPLKLAPDNWYYKKFNLKYVEKFPLSGTLLVIFTDGYHLMQFVYAKTAILSIIMFDSKHWWQHGLAYLAISYIVFHLVYYSFSRKHAA